MADASRVTAPSGTEEVQLPRLTSPVGNFLQVTSALFFASYFWFGPAMALGLLSISPVGLKACSWRTCGLILSAYFAQLVLYKPQFSRGWPALVLYSSLCDYVTRYYDGTCVREGPPLDPSGRYLFAMYPHGVYGVCRTFSGGPQLWGKLFPGIRARWGSFGGAFYVPGVREFSLFAGCLDASKPVLTRAAARGENISLLPGGIDEMMLTDGTTKVTKLVTVDRKGYAKLAIEQGMDIVPGFCFGEKWIHKTVQLPLFLRRFLRRFRMSGTLLKGRGPTFLGFLGVPLGFVWAEPVRVKQQSPVDPAYLDEIHDAVQASLKDVFERYKGRFGYAPDETLVFVSPKEAKAAAQQLAGGREGARKASGAVAEKAD